VLLPANLNIGIAPTIDPRKMSTKVTSVFLILAAAVQAKSDCEKREAAKGKPSRSL
jgi:hypothetical protein